MFQKKDEHLDGTEEIIYSYFSLRIIKLTVFVFFQKLKMLKLLPLLTKTREHQIVINIMVTLKIPCFPTKTKKTLKLPNQS